MDASEIYAGLSRPRLMPGLCMSGRYMQASKICKPAVRYLQAGPASKSQAGLAYTSGSW